MSYDKTKQLKFSEKDLEFWRAEIKLARQKKTDVATRYDWDGNLKRYDAAAKDSADVNTQADFRDVERKKAALFYTMPDVGLSVVQDYAIAPPGQNGKPLMLSTLVSWHQDILNKLLGPTHANAMHAIRKAIFNCLCTAGVGPVTVGYQVTMAQQDQQTPVLDDVGQPVMAPPSELESLAAAVGMAPMPKPMMQTITVDVPIHEKWFITDVSPKSLLIPATHKDTNYQRALWLGHEWQKPTSQVRREFSLPAEWTGRNETEDSEQQFEHTSDVKPDDGGDPMVTGVDLYYRQQLRSDTDVHPEAMIKLSLVDGYDQPLCHEMSPHQGFLESGDLAPDSLLGFTVRPLALRDLTDSAWVPSDVSMTAQLTKEGNKYRTQIIENRDGNKQVIGFDSDKLDPTATDKIKKANGVIWVPLSGGALSGGKDTVMVQVASPTLGREQYMGMDVIDRDREQILGISANQSGVQTKGKKTATEQSIVQRNSEARFEQERNRVLEWFLDVVAAFDTLVIRYGDARIASQILGPERGQVWAQHKQFLAGGYTHTLQVDSGKYIDIDDDRRQWLQFYNMVRKDPFVNPRPILTKLAEVFGQDPAEFVVEPQKPEKELKAAISLKGEDLNPMNPAFAINVSLLRQAGWQIDEQSVQIAQQQAMAAGSGMPSASGVGPIPGQGPAMTIDHPGAQPKMDTLNQHQLSESGDRSGPKVM